MGEFIFVLNSCGATAPRPTAHACALRRVESERETES